MHQIILWQRAEAAMVFVAGIALFLHAQVGIPWWGALLLFLAPDLSFAGYGFGPKIGAICYNAAHLYGLGAGLLAVGALAALPLCTALGALWLAHAGFDRMLGYGLKSPEGFSITHLGRIGRRAGS